MPGQHMPLNKAVLRKRSGSLDKELIMAAKELDILEEVHRRQFPKTQQN